MSDGHLLSMDHNGVQTANADHVLLLHMIK